MNILMITPYIYPDIGGLESYAYELAQELSKNNHKLTILSSYKTKEKTIFNKKIRVIKIPRTLKISNTPISLTLYKEIRKLDRKEKFDLIISHTPVPFFTDVAALYSKIHKKKHIIFYHSGSLYKRSIIDIIAVIYENTIQKLTLKTANKIIVLNPFVKKYLKLAHVECVKMGFYIPRISKKELEHSIKKRKKQILFVGNLAKSHKWKGLNYLIKAMSIVQRKQPKYTLIVAGEGNNIQNYKQLAQRLNIKARFIGRKSGKELEKTYKESCILVLPSISKTESFGRVIIEAARYGVPCVASKIGGIPYVIKNKAGKLVEAKNPEKLAQSILSIIEDEKKYKEYSINAYELAKEYTWKKAIKEIEGVIENVRN